MFYPQKARVGAAPCVCLGGGGQKRARSTRIDRYGRIREIKSRGGGVSVLAVCVNSDRRRFAGCVLVEMIKGLFRMVVGRRGVSWRLFMRYRSASGS